ncbi:MAG: lipopolysaccharide assembly protein LapA domain-containing protein [Pseudomonadota bacterium]
MVVLVLVGLVVVFVIQNVVAVEVRFLFWSLGISLSLLIFLLLVTGVIVGWFLRSYISHRRNKSMRKGG